ncbi:MAG: ubiquinone/menaquinone biosynthesis methyltransferase [Gemmatimonadales bacterium]
MELPSAAAEEKRSYVKRMFTAIAPRYDLLNHLLSLNIDKRWRREAVKLLGWGRAPSGVYLDLCAGTLDLAAELAGRPRFRGRVVAADFVVEMLALGRGKAEGVRAVGADALALPFPSAHFSGCMVGFGIRNLADIRAGLAEIARVLSPGGRLVVLEFSIPRAWPMRSLYLFYFRRLLPLIGKAISRHSSAYRYLPESVAGFPDPKRFEECLRSEGFRDVGARALTLGIATLYWGTARG